MFSISTIFLFMGAAVLLILIPGPDLIFAVTQGITNGRKAGVYTAVGLALGNTVHTLAAALGLSIIVKTSPGEKKDEQALLRRGLIMNVLNPKVAIFFLTFLPQFVNYDYGYIPLQMLVLGLIFIVLTAVIFGLLGYFAGVFSAGLIAKPRVQEGANVAAGIIFVGLGLKLLTTSL